MLFFSLFSYILLLQNYTAGNPSPVLYIKNLAKDVVADDFYFIFGKFVTVCYVSYPADNHLCFMGVQFDFSFFLSFS